MGLPFEGNEKTHGFFLSLKRVGILKMGYLLLNLRGRGSLKFWNAPLILTLEAVALVGVKARLLCGLRLLWSIGSVLRL